MPSKPLAEPSNLPKVKFIICQPNNSSLRRIRKTLLKAVEVGGIILRHPDKCEVSNFATTATQNHRQQGLEVKIDKEQPQHSRYQFNIISPQQISHLQLIFKAW